MRAPLLLVGLALTLPIVGGVSQLVLPMDETEWVAIRYRWTPGTTLQARAELHRCVEWGGNWTQAFGSFQIRDGRPLLWAYTPGGGFWGVIEPRLLEAGVNGQQFHTPVPPSGLFHPFVYNTNGWCGPTSSALNTEHQNSPKRETTIVFFSTLPGTIFANATWNHGDVEIDIARGPVTLLKPHQFENGAAVGVSPPIEHGASVGALLSHRLTPERDFIGYWWPWTTNLHVGEAFCYRDGVDCSPPPYWYASTTLVSEGPTTWEFGYDVRAERITPHFPLLGIELTGDDYVYS